MLEILKTLRDTPLPIILVIGGLVFLLVPFIRRVSDKVEVETTNKGLAGFIGFILLAVGVGLYIIPSQSSDIILPTALPPSITSVTETVVQPTNIVQQPAIPASTSAPTSATCFDWDTCWSFDDNAKTMTWLGASNGDIGQRGIPLTKLQSGYTAIITISVPMTIEICKGTLDSVEIAKDCTPQFLTIESGVHKITSAGNQGGFRAYPK